MRLLQELRLYLAGWGALYERAREEAEVDKFSRFLASSPEVFQRNHPPGHFTGSGLLASADLTRVALMHHKKLDKWLQFGGHADGEEILAQVACKECEEESGIPAPAFLPYEEALGLDWHPLPFDLDVHTIPARGADPEHLHYDVRYLLYTNRPDLLRGNAESHDLGWFTLAEARALTDEPSMHRQFAKLEWLKARLATAAR